MSLLDIIFSKRRKKDEDTFDLFSEDPEIIVRNLKEQGCEYEEISKNQSREPYTIVFSAKDTNHRKRFYSISVESPLNPKTLFEYFHLAKDYCKENSLEFSYLRGNSEKGKGSCTIGKPII